MVVVGGLLDGEGQHHLRIEGLPCLLGEPGAGGEHQPVGAGAGRVLGQPAAAVVVGDAVGEQVLPGEQPDGDARGRTAEQREATEQLAQISGLRVRGLVS